MSCCWWSTICCCSNRRCGKLPIGRFPSHSCGSYMFCSSWCMWSRRLEQEWFDSSSSWAKSESRFGYCRLVGRPKSIKDLMRISCWTYDDCGNDGYIGKSAPARATNCQWQIVQVLLNFGKILKAKLLLYEILWRSKLDVRFIMFVVLKYWFTLTNW